MSKLNTEAKKYRKLFVGGLSRETNEAYLKTYFEQWGKVMDCVVVRNPVTGISKGFSFLVFKESVTLDEIQACRPHIIDNQCVETRRAMPYYKNPGELRNVKVLYAGRVRKDTTESDIRGAFSKYGDIEKIEWVINNSGKYTGYLFLTFRDIDSVDKCVLQSRVLVNNTKIVVSRAVPKSETEQTSKTPLPSNYLQFNPYVSQPFYPGTYSHGSSGVILTEAQNSPSPVYYSSTPLFGYPCTVSNEGTTFMQTGYPTNSTAYLGPTYFPHPPLYQQMYGTTNENEASENLYSYSNEHNDDCSQTPEQTSLLRQHL